MINIYAVMVFVLILAVSGFLLLWKAGHFDKK